MNTREGKTSENEKIREQFNVLRINKFTVLF